MPGRSFAVLTLLAMSCTRGEPSEAPEAVTPAVVTCAAVAPRSFADVIVVRGVVAPPPHADAVVGSVVAGRVSTLTVEAGDHVRAGQVVAVVEDPALPAGAASGRAELEAARAEATAADTARARVAEMARVGVSSRQELEDADARAATAHAAVASAQAHAGAAAGEAARATIRAPIAGTVLRVFRRVGEGVDGTPATPIVEIADVTKLELRGDATAIDLMRLAPGAAVEIDLDGASDAHPGGATGPTGAALHGTITRVAPAVDPATAVGEVRIAIAASDRPLVAGLTATARIALAPRAGLAVPPSAVRRSDTGGDEVVTCVAGPTGTGPAGLITDVVAVEIGARLPDAIELTSGVVAGDRVVVDRALGLVDEQPLIEARR